MVKPQINLSFEGIRSEIKQFLKSQTKFKDYDFEGSNMAVLIDVLAYNTYQNNFNVNLALNETFLDSAQLRSSVISHAKELNYLPRSMTSARAIVDVVITPSTPQSTIFIPINTKFTAVCGNDTFTFTNEKSATIIPNRGVYAYRGLEIYEGTRIDESFVVGDGTRYIISNKNVDISSVIVSVHDDNYDVNGTLYGRNTSIYGVAQGSIDKVFYINAAFDDQYEISFGRNLFGYEPIAGQIVKISYRITKGSVANNISNFTSQNIGSFPAVINTTSSSSGGADRESIEDIRYFAPKSLQIQDRVVTENDYKIILKQSFPEIADVSVYGGDKANPPQYGKVIVAVNQHDNNRMTGGDIEKYTTFLKSKSPISIDPVIISPQFVYLYIDTNIKVDFNKLTKGISDIQSLVLEQIKQYASDNLEKFDYPFLYSKLIGFIDDVDTNIISNKTTTRMIIEYVPSINVENNISLSFSNKLKIDLSFVEPAFVSSTFTFNGIEGYLRDDGLGYIDVINNSSAGNQYLAKNIGTINYATGDVKISKLVVSSLKGSAIKMYASCDDKDISVPLGRIFKIRDEDITIRVTNING